MATEHFCLRWNNHQSTLVSVFDNLLESGTLVDCTLAADGRYLKAHKVVLSACSPYLGMLLSQHYDKHPIIILKDVKFDELKAMLDYMYRGEVNISQEQLSTFLKAAETLQIKGLTDAGSDEGNGLQPNRPPSSNSTTSANEDPQSPGPPGDGGSSPGPRKRKRNKHGDDGEGDSASKISLSEGSDRLSATSVGSPSTKSASVKREPVDGEGEGQMSVDESGEVMMSRPGPSNGGTNNKAPWILSADSSGEEMQLTPTQDKQLGEMRLQDKKIKKEDPENDSLDEEMVRSWNEENRPNTQSYPRIVYARSGEEELIIPDNLEEPNLLNSLDENVHSFKSNCTAFRRDEGLMLKMTSARGDFKDGNNVGHQKVRDLTSASNKTNINDLNKNKEYVQKSSVKVVQNSALTSNSKPHSVPLNNALPDANLLLEINKKSSQSSLLTSTKPVVNISKVSNQKKEEIKNKTVNLTTKYRNILPLLPSTVPSPMKTNENPSAVSSVPNLSSSSSNSSIRNVVQNSTSVGSTNNSNCQQNQPGVLNRSSSSPVFSVPQQIQVGQLRNQTPSLIPMPQPLQGNQIINNPANVIRIPQNVQSSQISNINPSVLSITPQFAISPIQIGNSQMPFSNSPLQSGNFQNPQFCVSQSQVSSQNSLLTQQAQPVLRPVFMTPSVMSSCQTTNQFFPSTVQYSFSSAQSYQPNFAVSTSQSQPNMNSTTQTSSASAQPVYVRTPGGFVPATVTKITNYKGKGTPQNSLPQGNDRFSPSQRNMPTLKNLLEK